MDHEAGRRGCALFIATRACSDLPAETQKVLEVQVRPLSGLRGPGTLEATGEGVVACSSVFSLEHLAHAWVGVAGAFQGTWPGAIGACTVHLAECMATADECNLLSDVKAHVPEDVLDVCRLHEKAVC